MEIVKYGLAIKGTNTPLGFDTQRGGEEFCVDIEYTLDSSESNVWLVDTIEEAEEAKNTKPEWYNASYSTPRHPYKDPDLEVAKVILKVEVI